MVEEMPREKRAPRSVSDLAFEEQLGKGSFGTVYKARNKANDELLAVKEIMGKSSRSKLEFLKEAKVLRMVNHPCLLRLVAIFVQEEEGEDGASISQKLYLVTEFCSGGALSSILVNDDVLSIPWETRVRFAHECAMGLRALHDNNLIHRDLKSENCLLKAIPDRPTDLTTFSHLSIVLGDFGLARWFSPDSFPRKRSSQLSSSSKSQEAASFGESESTCSSVCSSATDSGSLTTDSGSSTSGSSSGGNSKSRVGAVIRKATRNNSKMTVRGTPWSMAPELMDPKYNAGYTIECDIFSLGVVLLEIACRRLAQNIPRNEALSVDMNLVEAMSINPPPSSKRKTLFSKKFRPRRDSIRDACPPKYLGIAKQCVDANPDNRPDIYHVEEFLRGLRSDSLPDDME